MNKVTRRKLGIIQSDAKAVTSEAIEKLSEVSPITENVESKDYTSYSNINIKSINIGTLRKPVERLAIYDETLKAYIPIEIKVSATNPARYYASKSFSITLDNSEITNYQTNLKVDQNNPYDPLFSSFDRLYSLPVQKVIQSGTTGIRIGEKEKFFNLSSGFDKSSVIDVNGAANNLGRSLNGIFTPTDIIENNRPVYVNNTIAFPAFITFSNNPSGWVISQSNRPTATSSPINRPVIPRKPSPLYFLPSTGLPVGTGWVSTGIGAIVGELPAPTSYQQDFEGFFKLAATRVSKNKNRLYASFNNSTLTVGDTSGSLPSNNSWVTYPHSYNIESFPAFRYPVSLHFAGNSSGVKDLIVISTGRSEKNIVYVSPHSVAQFQGFWSELSGTTRVPKTGAGGNIISTRPILVLESGNLITITSENNNVTGLNFATVTGIGEDGLTRNLYNFDKSILKQDTPLSQTAFYQLYEPVYKKFAIKTGTWDGVIPSGVSFSIETLRTKNSEIISPKIEVHVHSTFVNVSPSGSGDYQFIRPFNYEMLAGIGKFDGYANRHSAISALGAEYIANNTAKKQAKSKLRGYLWEKGLTVDNHRVKQVLKLFGTKLTSSGVDGESSAKPKYCLPYNNPSDPLSCSYTGVNRGIYGVPTSAGLRLIDQNSTFIPNYVDAEGDVIKFIPVTEN